MLRKRWLALVSLSVAATSIVAYAATTYQVQTKLSTTGGTLKVRDKVVQTAAGVVVYNNFTTSALIPVTVTAIPGYTIASITQTGKAKVTNPSSPWNGTFVKSSGLVQSLVASFTVLKSAVSTQVTANSGDSTGTVSPASASVNYNGSVTLTATPSLATGYVDAVTVNGIPYPGTPARGSFPITISNVTSGKDVSVTFKSVTVSAGPNKVGSVGSPITLSGSATGNGALSWSQTGGPAVTISNATTATPSFIPSAAATYSFTVTDSIGGVVLASSTVQATAVASATDSMRISCNGCHGSAGAAPSAAFGQWSSSLHKQTSVNCVSCHTDSAMPTPVNTASVDAGSFQILASNAGSVGTNYCAKCHAASVTSVQASRHYNVAGTKLVCTDCHDQGHNPKFNPGACASCHAVVNDHTAEAMAGKTCIQCHDKHNAGIITGSLGPATAHPAVTLYTFEEIGMQMAGGQPVPVQVDANGQGMPYSPKQTCGTSGCHVKNGVDYTYDKISDHAFHSNEGRSEYVDSSTGKFDATKNKPWTQSSAMVGKW